MKTPARTLLAPALAPALALALAVACGPFAVGSAQAADAAPAPASAASANVVRPEFGNPFNAAQAAIKSGDAQTALAKLKEAEAVGNLSPYETYLVARVRGPALYTAGDLPGAEKDLEASLGSTFVPDSDKLPLTKALSTIYYTDKKYDQAASYMQKYLAAGGDDAQIKELLPQSFYLSKKYPEAAKAYEAMVEAQIAAGQKPDVKTLRLLASAQNQAEDDAGYEKTIEKLAVMYPAAEYWNQIIANAKRAPFDDRLYVDVYRLRAAALGQVPDAEKLSYAGQAAHAGYPAEALAVLDQGMAKNAFTGPDAAEAKKLRDTVSRGAQSDRAQLAANEKSGQAAKDGEALVNLGLAVAMDGQAEKGLGLMQQGIAKGGLKRPEDAKLHLGIVQWRAGHGDDALKTLQSVTGTGTTAALAHAWVLVVQSGAKPA